MPILRHGMPNTTRHKEHAMHKPTLDQLETEAAALRLQANKVLMMVRDLAGKNATVSLAADGWFGQSPPPL